MQEASGIVLWNSLHESPRLPFVMPAKVTWSKLSTALNRYIQKRTKAKDGSAQVWNLTPRNLNALGAKVFGSADFCADSLVSSEKFLQREGQKGFWDWFYAAVKLLKESDLGHYWNRGYVADQSMRSSVLRMWFYQFFGACAFDARACSFCFVRQQLCHRIYQP